MKRFPSSRNYLQYKGFGALPLWARGPTKFETLCPKFESKDLSVDACSLTP